MSISDSLKFLREIAEDQPRGVAEKLRNLAADLELHEKQVAPFKEWAQEYLDGGRWAGYTYFEAIKTELLERDRTTAAQSAELAAKEQRYVALCRWRHDILAFLNALQLTHDLDVQEEVWSACFKEIPTDSYDDMLKQLATANAELERLRGEMAGLAGELERTKERFGRCSRCGYLAWTKVDDTTEECQFCKLRTELSQTQASAAAMRTLLQSWANTGREIYERGGISYNLVTNTEACLSATPQSGTDLLHRLEASERERDELRQRFKEHGIL